jgi:AraC-like DNA-binding protein
MKLSKIDIASLLTLIQLLLLAIIVFSYKKGKRLSNLLLGGFLVSNAMIPGNYFLILFHWLPGPVEPYVAVMGSTAYALLMPFLYLYIQSLCDHRFRIKPGHLLHGLLYVIIVIFSFIILWLKQSGGQGTILPQQADQTLFLFMYGIIHGQVATYLVIIFKVIADYRRKLKDYYSTIEQINLQWFKVLLFGFAIMWLLNFLQWIFWTIGIQLGRMDNTLTFISVILNLLFALIVTYNSIVKSDYLSGIAVPKRYSRSRLKLADYNHITQKLISYMDHEKPYLNPSLSLKDLSLHIKIPVRNISQSIHLCLKSNFYDFINRYRVEEVKRRLGEESSQHFSFLGLAYEAGFNSKSAFNAAFKKYVGMTPKQFKHFFPKGSDKL